MNAALHTQLSVIALACSGLALLFSLLAAFPGLKMVLAAVRDGVLWFALFLILGCVGFVAWEQISKSARPAAGPDAKSTPQPVFHATHTPPIRPATP